MVSDIGRFETICSAILPTSLLFWFYLITLQAEKSFDTIEGKVTIVLYSRVQTQSKFRSITNHFENFKTKIENTHNSLTVLLLALQYD